MAGQPTLARRLPEKIQSDGMFRGPIPRRELLLRLRRDAGRHRSGASSRRALREAIRAGGCGRGERLPPTRTLAEDLGVSRRLVVEAFDQLAAEGWLDARVGSGTFVRPRARPGATRRASVAADRAGAAPPPRRGSTSSPAIPTSARFPRAAWARATRDALRELPDAAFGYGDPRGLRELRVAIADAPRPRPRRRLPTRARSSSARASCRRSGILVRATRRAAGGRCGSRSRTPTCPSTGTCSSTPAPTSSRSRSTSSASTTRRSPPPGAELALLTPAHQCPTGVVLVRRPPGGAGRAGPRPAQTLLVEDDYDAEYRYDRAPLAALQALAPDRVVYLGSASKTLAPADPAWRGWWCRSRRLAGRVAAKRYADARLAGARAGGARAADHRRGLRAPRPRRPPPPAAPPRRPRRRRRRATCPAARVERHRRRPARDRRARAAGRRAAARRWQRARAPGVGIYPLSLWRADPPPETIGDRARLRRPAPGCDRRRHARCRSAGRGALETPGVDLGLRRRACIVTGASRGIGAATAEMLAGEGASRCCSIGRDGAALAEVAAELRRGPGARRRRSPSTSPTRSRRARARRLPRAFRPRRRC